MHTYRHQPIIDICYKYLTIASRTVKFAINIPEINRTKMPQRNGNIARDVI